MKAQHGASGSARSGSIPLGKLFKSYPSANNYSTGDGLNTATYLWNPPTRNTGPHFMFRLDHTFNEKHSIYGRYIHATQDTRDGDPLNGRPQVFPGFPPLGEVERRTKNLAINYRWVISPMLINEFTMGFARFVYLFTQRGLTAATQ